MIAFKVWDCTCGNRGWAVESLDKAICNLCGKVVETRTSIDKTKLTENDKFTLKLLEHAKKARESA